MDTDSFNSTPQANLNQTLEVRFVSKHHGATKKDTAELFWDDISQIGSKLIKQNGDKDGITKSKLAYALESGKLSSEQEMVAGSLYDNLDIFQKSSRFQIGEQKVSDGEFRKFTERALLAEKNFVKADNLTYWADDQGNLRKLASDKNAVTMSDIERAQASKESSAQDRAMLAELKANFSSIAKTGKIGKAEIDQYWKFAKNAQDYKDMAHFYSEMRAIETNQQNPIAHRLFENAKLPAKSIVPDAIQQGYAGDCAILAALGSLAANRPNEIASMIKVAGSNYQVKFPIFKSAFPVQAPSSYELGLYLGEKNKYGNWPLVITKAFGQYVYNTTNPINRIKMDKMTRAEWAGENGSLAKAIVAITGHDANFTATKNLSITELRDMLLKAKNEKRIVVLGTGTGKNPTVDGFKPAHAFSVIDVESSKNNELAITVRDPANKGKDDPRGTTKISLAKLMQNFDRVCEESTQKQVER